MGSDLAYCRVFGKFTLEPTLWQSPFLGSMDKRNTLMPQIWQRSQVLNIPDPKSRIPSSHPKLLSNSLKIPPTSTNPSAGIWLIVKGRGGRVKFMERWGNGGKDLHIYGSASVLSRFSHVWVFTTLWTVAHQAPLSMEFSRQEYWSGLPRPSPGDLPNPGTEPASLRSPALAGGFFTTSVT